MCAGVGHASVVTTQVYTPFCGHTEYFKRTISMWSSTLSTDNLNHFSLHSRYNRESGGREGGTHKKVHLASFDLIRGFS